MLLHSPWIEFPQLIKAVQGKKVIFWGCYDWFERTSKVYKFNIDYIVDSSKNQQGPSAHHGYDVKEPIRLKHIKHKNKFYIIITTTAFYETIERLIRYGFKPGLHFCVTPLLNNFKVIDDMLSHKQKVILSSSDTAKRSDTEGGGLYIYHVPSCKIEKKISGVTRGFDRYKDNYFVVDALKGVRILDENFKDIDNFPLPKQCVPHGVTIDSERKLIYVVLARYDKVVAFNINNFKIVRTISLTKKYEKTGVYHHHMNDICLDGDSLYISMFSKTGNVQLACFDSAIIEYDLDSDKVTGTLVENLWLPHSIRVLDGRLCYLDSMRGNLHIIPHKIETHFNGFIRGLDFDGIYYYIGQSLHRYFDRMKGYSNNISLDCGFFIFDNASKASKFFSMPRLRDINTLKVLEPLQGIM